MKIAPPIVLAAAAGTEFKDLQRELATHQCSSCKGVFKVNSAVLENPFCVHCGSTDVKAEASANAQKEMAVPEEADVVGVQCANDKCKALNVMDLSLARHIDAFHCVVCGCGLHVSCDYDDHDHDEPPAGEEVPPAAAKEPAGDEQAAPGKGEDGGPETTVDPDAAPEGAPAGTDTSPEGQGGEPPKGDLPPPAEGEEPPVEPPSADPEPDADHDVVEVDLCDMIDPESASASLIASADAIYIRAGGKVVAELRKENAGANSDIFDTDSFANAISAMLEKEGLKEAIQAFAFTPYKVTVSFKGHVAKQIEAGVAAAKAELAAQVGDDRKAFQQCLSISILGHVTGLFKDVKNPVQSQLIEQLSGLNVRGASKLVQTAFASNSKEFSASVLKKAAELMASTPEYRNDIAANLDTLNPMALATDTDEGAPGSEDLEDRLESTSRTVTASRTPESVPATGRQPQVAAILQRRATGGGFSPYGL